MRLVRTGATLALALLAACSGGGGELREETARRRAANAIVDSAAPGEPVDSAGDFRLPAFVDTAPAPPAADTTPAAPPASAQAEGQWSASPREAGKAGANASILRGMRVGLNAGFDRLVLDFGDSPVPPYQIEYVDAPVRQCGSGDPVQVAGQGRLLVRLRSARAHDDAGRATVRDRRVVPTTPVLRHVEIVCDFEAQVEVAMGVHAPNPFRVLVVPTPNRLIVDIRH